MTLPRNAAPKLAQAEEVVLAVLQADRSETGLRSITDYNVETNNYPDVAPDKIPLFCVYKRMITRPKRRLGSYSPGGPEWVTLEWMACCSEGEAKRGRARVLADAVTAAIEAQTYPATISGRKVASIKCREGRADVQAISPVGEMLPDRMVRLEISVKLN